MLSDVDTVALLIEAAWDASQSRDMAEAWRPQPGPQTDAYNCDADIIGYGGEAGGGKTDLLLGIAGTKHRRSIIFRREFPRLEGVIARSREIFGAGKSIRNDTFNETLHRWTLEGGERTIQLGSMKDEDDKRNYQGRPYDGVLFDEVTEFTESQFRFVTAWNRSTYPGQKCRVVMTFNPPMDETQEWVTRYFSAWLDETHPNPAKDGELRWYAMIKGKETEVSSGEAFENDGRKVKPKSRTFFRASLKDNPILEATGYASTIDALPEPLRSILQGNFKAGKIANPWQVIPTEWIKAAIERGRNTTISGRTQTALGADVARGGKDKTVLAPLHGEYFSPLLKFPGSMTPDGPSGAALIVANRQSESAVAVDVVGIGSSVYDSAVQLGIPVIAFNGSEGTELTDKSGILSFRNVRSASYWLFREALDPDNGSGVCLPDDPELLSDLAAPRFKVIAGKIIVESKDDDAATKTKGIRSRLGRSPDCGDAVVISWWAKIHSGPLFYDDPQPKAQTESEWQDEIEAEMWAEDDD